MSDDASTTDIVAFLNARADEAEASARHKHDLGCDAVPSVFDMSEGPCDCGLPARLLRGVQAKRQIIEECRLLRIVGIAFPGEAGPESAGRILRHLAAADCDHSDYRPEWAQPSA